MNTTTARSLASRIAELIEITSIFQARYGKQYRMKPGSPAAAWDMHQSIFDHQVAIARLLDETALLSPRQSATWWKWQETMDTAVASGVAQEISRLIAACACFEAEPRAGESPMVTASQRAIAGMLHPSALMVAQAEPVARAS